MTGAYHIEAQLELERRMTERGVENYLSNTAKAEEHGRAADTSYAKRITGAYIATVADGVRSYLDTKRAGKRSTAHKLLSACDPAKAAYFALQAVFNAFTYEAQLASVAIQIGRMLEDELRFRRFGEQHSAYYQAILADFRRKGTQSYRHKHRVLTHKANELGDQWAAWSPTDRAHVGMKLLDIILTGTDLAEKRTVQRNGKTVVYLVPTEAAMRQINEHNDFAKYLFPEKMPCCIPPDPWTGINQGGYYSPELRRAVPMVKTSSKRHRGALADARLGRAMEALNAVQRTPWQVNAEVHAVVKAAWSGNLAIGMPHREPLTIPASPVQGVSKDALTDEQQEQLADWKHEAAELYTRERERISKSLLMSRVLSMADDYASYARFWYVWYMDFRGRMYSATAGFSPQGPDVAKALIRFADGKPLGDRGWYWLRVHGANRFGYDKASYDERVAWVDAQRDAFIAAANDPMSHTGLWSQADKPWQFLAFLFEYRDCCAMEATGRSPAEYVSHLPVGLDGSCNGLQNFSAALRDSIGGRATNLLPASKPADIYSKVAEVCTRKLRELGSDPMAQSWLAFCVAYGKGQIPRSMAKRPVMTLPYGATRQSCTKYIFEAILSADREHFTGNFKAACWLTPLLWESIGEVVVAARDAMGWLQKCSSAVSRENEPLVWEAPDGFRVYQASRNIEIDQIETQLAGRFRLNVGHYTDTIDTRKQRSSVAPNFVHSLDAAHLRETVRMAIAENVTALAVIHDDFGTHAADTDKLHRIIREAFVSMYTENDPLEAFRQKHAAEGRDLPPLPVRGSLRIEQVLTSEYFFG